MTFRSRTLLAFAVLLAFCARLDALSISGWVVDQEGAPIAKAQVFVEQSIESPLLSTLADSEGAFRLDNVGEGKVGLFAFASGFAFGGCFPLVDLSDGATDVIITLGKPAQLKGQVKNHKGKAVQNARIARVGIEMASSKVGIPFSKLQSYGFAIPVTDKKGLFSISGLPEGAKAALKVKHVSYAQRAVSGISVGGSKSAKGTVEIVMYPGFLIQGEVLLKGEMEPIGNAIVKIQSMQPPHDTVLAKTDMRGKFALHLNPGSYMMSTSTKTYRSPGWKRVDITGSASSSRVSLVASKSGEVSGSVLDALTGGAIKGAKLEHFSSGQPANFIYTSASGAFRIDAAEGENVLLLKSAPGYTLPKSSALRVQVVSGKNTKLPTFWLAPLPTYKVEVVDEQMKPVPNAIVTVLRPVQFGWRKTDEKGCVDLQFNTMPPDGRVIGMVEDASGPRGALFAIERGGSKNPMVQLMPLSTTKGKVVTLKGGPIEGALVAAFFNDEVTSENVPLWRTVSAKDGVFHWDSIIPFVPQRCQVQLEGRAYGAPVIRPEKGQAYDLGKIEVDTVEQPGKSYLGKKIKWRANRVLSGQIDRNSQKPALLIYCSAETADMTAGAAAVAEEMLDRRVQFAVIVDGKPGHISPAVPVLSGKKPATATTYLLDNAGTVVLETFGFPPLRAIQRLIKTKE